MSTKDKLIERFKKLPKDFTFDELTSVMTHLGFKITNKGATSGSRIGFIKGTLLIKMHKPHPQNIVGYKTLKEIQAFLNKEKLWEN